MVEQSGKKWSKRDELEHDLREFYSAGLLREEIEQGRYRG
jgi:hypothetical protein